MISKIRRLGMSYFTPICDLCGEELEAEHGFQLAVASMKAEGWGFEVDGFGHYTHLCAACKTANKARRGLTVAE